MRLLESFVFLNCQGDLLTKPRYSDRLSCSLRTYSSVANCVFTQVLKYQANCSSGPVVSRSVAYVHVLDHQLHWQLLLRETFFICTSAPESCEVSDLHQCLVAWRWIFVTVAFQHWNSDETYCICFNRDVQRTENISGKKTRSVL